MKDASDWKSALSALAAAAGPAAAAEPEQAAAPQPQAPLPELRIELDKKRAGKTATIIYGFDPADPRAEQAAAHLKRKLAVGGSCRGGEILLQGDLRQRAAALLREFFPGKTKIKVL